MNIAIYENEDLLGRAGADIAEQRLGEAIRERGSARLVLSTGASQFSTLQALVQRPIDWARVEMFHLDEYVGLPESHPASFRRYLRERFLAKAPVGRAHLVNGEGDVAAEIAALSQALRSAPADVAFIGIGENAHIAFNDPPADFDTREAFMMVELDDGCKRQQVGEGWFPDVEAVPARAISMTPWQIMQARTIVSCVPGARKARAMHAVLAAKGRDPMVPATLLREHPDMHLLLDEGSASELGALRP